MSDFRSKILFISIVSACLASSESVCLKHNYVYLINPAAALFSRCDSSTSCLYEAVKNENLILKWNTSSPTPEVSFFFTELKINSKYSYTNLEEGKCEELSCLVEYNMSTSIPTGNSSLYTVRFAVYDSHADDMKGCREYNVTVQEFEVLAWCDNSTNVLEFHNGYAALDLCTKGYPSANTYRLLASNLTVLEVIDKTIDAGNAFNISRQDLESSRLIVEASNRIQHVRRSLMVEGGEKSDSTIAPKAPDNTQGVSSVIIGLAIVAALLFVIKLAISVYKYMSARRERNPVIPSVHYRSVEGGEMSITNAMGEFALSVEANGTATGAGNNPVNEYNSVVRNGTDTNTNRDLVSQNGIVLGINVPTSRTLDSCAVNISEDLHSANRPHSTTSTQLEGISDSSPGHPAELQNADDSITANSLVEPGSHGNAAVVLNDNDCTADSRMAPEGLTTLEIGPSCAPLMNVESLYSCSSNLSSTNISQTDNSGSCRFTTPQDESGDQDAETESNNQMNKLKERLCDSSDQAS